MTDPLGLGPTSHYAAVIVATELYPFTGGGIGVMYGNLLATHSSGDAKILFVNASFHPISSADFSAHYPRADLANVGEILMNSAVLDETAFGATAVWHYQGYLALQALLRLSRAGVSWGCLEFQDFGGLAAPTLLARPLHPELQEARISLRIHGPEAVLRQYSPRAPWHAHLVIMDLERTAVSLADSLITHTPGVVGELERCLGLVKLDRKVILQRPPIGHCNGVLRHAQSRLRPRCEQSVFASKLDAIKAPETFLQAAELLFRRRPHRRSKGLPMLLMADQLPGADAATGRLMTELRQAGDAIRWMPDLTQQTRLDLIAESCVVISSPFEAFCLLAYEAALLGGRPVLNAANQAFGPDSVWVDGVNCWKFDGTAADLAQVLTDKAASLLSAPLEWQPDRAPYWHDENVRTMPTPKADTGGSVGIVVTSYNLEDYISDCLQSLSDQRRKPDAVVIVDDGSAEPADLDVAIDAWDHSGIKTWRVRNDSALGLGAARNAGINVLDTEYVLFLDADDILDPSFLDRACKAMDRDDAVDAVVPYVACITDHVDYMVGLRSHVLPFLGGTHFSRYVANHISTATALVRRSALPERPFDTSLPMYEDWDLWCSLAETEATFCVDHEIGLWYRQRPDSMTAEFRGTVVETYARDRVRTNALRRRHGLVPAPVLTDLNPHFSSDPVPDSPPPASDPSADTALLAQLERLQAVEAEAERIFNRRVVRLSMRLADLRHTLTGRRSKMAHDSVFGDHYAP